MSINNNNMGLRFQRGNLKPDQKPRKPSPRARKNPTDGKTKPPTDKNFIDKSEHIMSIS